MLRIRSADGTSIRCWREGAGPPLVLVHGTTPITPRSGSSPPFWRAASPSTPWIVAAEARAKTPPSTPRRSRTSLPSWPRFGPDVALFGHSFGADLALQASARTSNLSRLVLYEPGGGGDGDLTNVQARLETLIAASEREAAPGPGLPGSRGPLRCGDRPSLVLLDLVASPRGRAYGRPGAADRGGLQVQARAVLGDERPLKCCCSVTRVRRGRGPRPRPWRRPGLTPRAPPRWAGTGSQHDRSRTAGQRDPLVPVLGARRPPLHCGGAFIGLCPVTASSPALEGRWADHNGGLSLPDLRGARAVDRSKG